VTTAALVRQAHCFELRFDRVADAVICLRTCLATVAQGSLNSGML